MTTFNLSLDALIDKATTFLAEQQDKAYTRAEEYDKLIDLINDPTLRAQAESVLVQGAYVGGVILGRLQDIFSSDEDEDAAEEPQDEEEETPKTHLTNEEVNAILKDLFGNTNGHFSL